MSSGESLGLFGVSETLNFEVPQFVKTLRANTCKVPAGIPKNPPRHTLNSKQQYSLNSQPQNLLVF